MAEYQSYLYKRLCYLLTAALVEDSVITEAPQPVLTIQYVYQPLQKHYLTLYTTRSLAGRLSVMAAAELDCCSADCAEQLVKSWLQSEL